MTTTLAPAATQTLNARFEQLRLRADQIEENDVIVQPGTCRQATVIHVHEPRQSKDTRKLVLADVDSMTVPNGMEFDVASAIRGYEIPCLLCKMPALAVIDIGENLPDAIVVCKPCDDRVTGEARAAMSGGHSTTPGTSDEAGTGQPRALYTTREIKS